MIILLSISLLANIYLLYKYIDYSHLLQRCKSAIEAAKNIIESQDSTIKKYGDMIDNKILQSMTTTKDNIIHVDVPANVNPEELMDCLQKAKSPEDLKNMLSEISKNRTMDAPKMNYDSRSKTVGDTIKVVDSSATLDSEGIKCDVDNNKTATVIKTSCKKEYVSEANIKYICDLLVAYKNEDESYTEVYVPSDHVVIQ